MLFSTDQGSLGKCANDVQKGDQVWAFSGSKTAFVLRPLLEDREDSQFRNRYRLVGPCDFVGQDTDNVDVEGHATQTIEIV